MFESVSGFLSSPRTAAPPPPCRLQPPRAPLPQRSPHKFCCPPAISRGAFFYPGGLAARRGGGQRLNMAAQRGSGFAPLRRRRSTTLPRTKGAVKCGAATLPTESPLCRGAAAPHRGQRGAACDRMRYFFSIK